MSDAQAHVLVVDDDAAHAQSIGEALESSGYDTEVVTSGDEGLTAVRQRPYDLVLTDLALGHGATGMDVLKRVKEVRPETAVVMITAHGSEKIAVEAMKRIAASTA